MKKIFEGSHQDEKCPIVCLHALGQPAVDAIWLRGKKLYCALKVMSLDEKIRTFLKENDPMVLKQIDEAIAFADQ